jgi:hypothetical protein
LRSAALFLSLLMACESKTVRYEGLPPGEPACSADILHTDRGQCIVAGKRFRCISYQTRHEVVVSCTPYRLWK